MNAYIKTTNPYQGVELIITTRPCVTNPQSFTLDTGDFQHDFMFIYWFAYNFCGDRVHLARSLDQYLF